jgi:CRP/FNR family transcriptional regulator, anaerobic regulatory protein
MQAEEIKKIFPSFDTKLAEEIAKKSQTKRFKQGDLIMKTGQYMRSTMLLVSGLIKIFREDEDGNEFFMYYLQPGQACALSMICATKQETSEILAKAAEDTAVIAIPIEYMDDLMLNYKNWYYFVLETYRSRFEELLLTIDHIAFRNMDERLMFYLKRQQQTLNTNVLQVSNTEIAQELNSSREVISRLMRKLSDKGLIKLCRNNIEIINLDIHA